MNGNFEKVDVWCTCASGLHGPLSIVGRRACAFMILLKFRKLNGECAARIEGEGVQRDLRV